jgi:hypothetical protein
MSYEVYGKETIKQEYRTLLDSNDPIDRLVLELVEEGKLKVGFVPLKGNRWQFIKKFIPGILIH